MDAFSGYCYFFLCTLHILVKGAHGVESTFLLIMKLKRYDAK